MQDKMPKKLIIIGGGASVQEGINKGLWNKIKGKFVVGLNYSYYYYKNPTFQCFVDRQFYVANGVDMEQMPLIIGNKHGIHSYDNTITLPSRADYKRDVQLHGCYKASLVGIFALSLCIHLLDEGEIFLIGFDYGELRKEKHTKFITDKIEANKIIKKDSKNRAITHFYQGDIEHRGVGKINYYNLKGRADSDFGVYAKEKKVKIYNVSKISKIKTFPTLTYTEFFRRIGTEKYNQDFIRFNIMEKFEQ